MPVVSSIEGSSMRRPTGSVFMSTATYSGVWP